MICHTGVESDERPSRMTFARVIPLRDDANELVAFHDEQRADMPFGHEADRLEHRVFRRDRVQSPAFAIEKLSSRLP